MLFGIHQSPQSKLIKIMRKILYTSIFLLALLTLFLSIRGLPGNPSSTELSTDKWKNNGPIELSPESSRLALTYSLVERKSVIFDLAIARFVTPDLGYVNGKYVSLFPPAVSFLAVPGYMLGKSLGASQVGAFATSAIFAFINLLLIYKNSRLLGAGKNAALAAGLIFLFATPAFVYATSLYQHHISTFLILMSIYVLLRLKNFLYMSVFWFLFAASAPVDYPNIFLMLPLALYAVYKIITPSFEPSNLKIKIWPLAAVSIVTAIFPILFFLGFNKASYGNPFQISGTIQAVKNLDENGLPKDETTITTPGQSETKKSAVGFFKTRNMLQGFYIHLISDERGTFFFTPVILFGSLGLFILIRKNHYFSPVLLGIVLMNLVFYSMWGDPWGGYAFGSRYFIPGYSILSIGLAILLTRIKKNYLLLLILFILACYSIAVNVLGAVTTSSIPPKGEAKYIETLSNRLERYSYDRNIYLLQTGTLKSFAYQAYFHNLLSTKDYYLLLVLLVTFLVALPIGLQVIKPDSDDV